MTTISSVSKVARGGILYQVGRSRGLPHMVELQGSLLMTHANGLEQYEFIADNVCIELYYCFFLWCFHFYFKVTEVLDIEYGSLGSK